jgi:hypothetical protein
LNIRFYAVSALIAAGVLCAAQTKAPKFEVGFGTTFPKLQAEKIGCSHLICIQQLSLFEGQDDGTCQHKPTTKPNPSDADARAGKSSRVVR